MSLVALLLLTGQDAGPLDRLREALKDVRTLSCTLVQRRKTALLAEPIVSSGTLVYRRDPARLVFRFDSPRRTVIHLDRRSYQVHRPDDRRLERLDFADDGVAAYLLALFDPGGKELERAFAVRGGDPLTLEPREEKVRERIASIRLHLAADGTPRRIVTADADGDTVEFELSGVKRNPDLPEKTFVLEVPPGTKVLRFNAGRK